MLNASGVGVYLRECLPCFLSSPHRFILLGETEALSQIVRDRDGAEIIGCSVKLFSVKELLMFPRGILKKINQCDLFYSPFFNIPGGIKVPVFTTIHDIIFPDMPELTSKNGLAARMSFYRRAFGRSKKIFTVSAFSRSRIEYYSLNRVPVVVTYSAIQPYLRDNKNTVRQKEDFIVFIGNIKKHKGLSYLIEAFLDARKEGLSSKLVIVGSKDNFRSSDSEFSKKINDSDPSHIEFTGPVSNEELASLLSRAKLLVQPSLYEGFGLPPLEAMIAGTRALISDIPVFREIYEGYPVAYFKAGDKDDLKEKLLSILNGGEPLAVTLSDELKNRYTFEKTASIILKELS
jgi:glycosyltransferase involved in cell wall biosynthesis